MAHNSLKQLTRLRVEKLPGVPIAVVLRAAPYVWDLKTLGDPLDPPGCFVAREVQRPLVEWREGLQLPGGPPIPRYFDAIMVRERFMELRSEQEFLYFLNQIGNFSPLLKVDQLQGWRLKDLTGFRSIFAELAKRSPDGWNKYANSLMSPRSNVRLSMLSALEHSLRHTVEFRWKAKHNEEWRGARNVAIIESTNAVSAIIATIELDHLRGTKFGVCARYDCPKFFEITSRHKRKYCCTYCAHLESMRRTRRRQQGELLSHG